MGSTVLSTTPSITLVDHYQATSKLAWNKLYRIFLNLSENPANFKKFNMYGCAGMNIIIENKHYFGKLRIDATNHEPSEHRNLTDSDAIIVVSNRRHLRASVLQVFPDGDDRCLKIRPEIHLRAQS
jgi:hypothetical protein